MTARIHRFDFGNLRDFRGPLVVEALRHTEAEEELTAPPPPVFSESDLEEARMAGKKQGYNEGFVAGQTDALKQVDHKVTETNELIAQFGDMLDDLRALYLRQLTEESKQLSALTLAIARKVAAEALDARSEACISAMVERCLPVIFSKPKIAIDVTPEDLEPVLNRIEDQLRSRGVEAEIEFRANPALSRSDIRLDWGTGQMIRDTEALWRDISEIMERTSLEFKPQETTLSPSEPQE